MKATVVGSSSAGVGWGDDDEHPPNPLTLREEGRFLALARNDMGVREGGE